MKNLTKTFCAIFIWSCCFNTVQAQTKNNKKTAKAAGIASMVNAKSYVFKANYANPSRGGSRYLTSDYDLTVAKDSIIAYLPYFGRAYTSNYGSLDNGIKFTSTNFDYKVTVNKKGSWNIYIVPKDSNTTNATAVQKLNLNISPDGYASLQIISFNRDPISFNGVIQDRGKPKK